GIPAPVDTGTEVAADPVSGAIRRKEPGDHLGTENRVAEVFAHGVDEDDSGRHLVPRDEPAEILDPDDGTTGLDRLPGNGEGGGRLPVHVPIAGPVVDHREQIGRASCRERAAYAAADG